MTRPSSNCNGSKQAHGVMHCISVHYSALGSHKKLCCHVTLHRWTVTRHLARYQSVVPYPPLHRWILVTLHRWTVTRHLARYQSVVPQHLYTGELYKTKNDQKN